jgi:pimeloyl-ACP methyl ester carboxylesterase
MIDLSKIDYSALDRLDVAAYLFHPRPDYGLASAQTDSVEEILIPVEAGVVIGARFHPREKSDPTLLFFHGNGEIVADYDELADVFTGAGVNFLPVDYRGYGKSTGRPSITNMMRDCHQIYGFMRIWLNDHGFSGPFIVMGRSLGSASALELLAAYGDKIDAVVIESGFANSQTLLNLLGIDLKSLGLREEDGFRNLDKIRSFGKPTLVIHAEYDHILPFTEGQALYEASPASEKKLLMIPGANHNDIFARGLKEYIQALRELAKKANEAMGNR